MIGAAQPWKRGYDPGVTQGHWWWWLHDPGGNVSPCTLLLSPQRVVLKGLLTDSPPATTTPPRTATSPVTMTCHLPATTRRPHQCAGRTAEGPCTPGSSHEGTEDPCGDWRTLGLLLSLSRGLQVVNKGCLDVDVESPLSVCALTPWWEERGDWWGGSALWGHCSLLGGHKFGTQKLLGPIQSLAVPVVHRGREQSTCRTGKG